MSKVEKKTIQLKQTNSKMQTMYTPLNRKYNNGNTRNQLKSVWESQQFD